MNSLGPLIKHELVGKIEKTIYIVKFSIGNPGIRPTDVGIGVGRKKRDVMCLGAYGLL